MIDKKLYKILLVKANNEKDILDEAIEMAKADASRKDSKITVDTINEYIEQLLFFKYR